MPASPPANRLKSRIALVTGASRGIGRAVALRYAAEGAHVIALARTEGALTELDDEIRALTGQPITLVAENITDYAKLDQMGGAIAQRYGKLDILAACAAMLGDLSPMGHYTPKMWDQVMAVNLTANWRLIRSLDPLLRASDAGRAIFVTSGVASNPKMYWGPYAVSKAALENMVKTYAAEMNHTKVRANLLSPGAVRTKMRAHAFPGEDPMTLPAPEDITDLFVEMAEAGFEKNGEVVRVES